MSFLINIFENRYDSYFNIGRLNILATESPLATLSDEMMLKIFYYLDTSQLNACSLVNKRWSRLANDILLRHSVRKHEYAVDLIERWIDLQVEFCEKYQALQADQLVVLTEKNTFEATRIRKIFGEDLAEDKEGYRHILQPWKLLDIDITPNTKRSNIERKQAKTAVKQRADDLSKIFRQDNVSIEASIFLDLIEQCKDRLLKWL